MGAIFTSPRNTVIAGIVLLIAIVLVIGGVTGQMTKIDHAWATFAMRWLHVVSGVLWIGLLWYLNFVQVPTMPTIQPVEHRAAISKYIAPNVLFFFRYAALATVIRAGNGCRGAMFTTLTVTCPNFKTSRIGCGTI